MVIGSNYSLNLDALESAMGRAEADMRRALNEALYAQPIEDRIWELRQSVLGDDAGPRPGGNIRGLAEALP